MASTATSRRESLRYLYNKAPQLCGTVWRRRHSLLQDESVISVLWFDDYRDPSSGVRPRGDIYCDFRGAILNLVVAIYADTKPSGSFCRFLFCHLSDI